MTRYMNAKLRDDYKRIMAVMTEVTGMSERMLISTRRYPTSFYRAMVAKELRDLGYTTTEVGEALGRDHSTITHGCNRLELALEGGFGYFEVVDAHQRFKRLLAAGEKEAPKSVMQAKAEEFVGLHCDKRCGTCIVPRSHCRFLQDEAIFMAGAQAQLEVLHDAAQKIRSAVAQCVCLCGSTESILEAVDGLEMAISAQS